MTNSQNGSTLNRDFSLDYSRESLSGLLHNFEANIVFTKKDGSEREMRCTLKQDLIPSYDKVTDRTREPKPDLLAVWDIDNDGWRTITIPNIISVEVVV